MISNSTLNVNTRLKRNQQKFKSPVLLPYIQQNIEEYVSLLRKTEQRVLECILWYASKYPEVHVSQYKIAKWCGITREWVNKILSKFESDGIVSMMYRHKQTSLYLVSPSFNEKVKQQISYIFRALKVFSLSLLFSNSKQEISSQYIIRKESFINILPKFKDSIRVRAHEKGRIGLKKRLGDVMLLPSDKKIMIEQLSKGVVPNNFVSSAIKNISIVKLTKAGQVKLMAFPDFVITEAENVVKKFSNLREPYAFLFSTCLKLCKEKKIAPDFEWINQLKNVLKITDSNPTVISNPSPPSRSLKQILDSQWKPEPGRQDIDREKEFSDAVEKLKESAVHNPFAAIMMRSLDKLKSPEL